MRLPGPLLFLTSALQLIAASPMPQPAAGGGTFVKTSDGVRLQYTQSGPAKGQQLLFVTGWRQAASEWRKQVDYFSSAGFRVTTYDMRGHGESEEPGFGYRISRFAADLDDLLAQLDLDKLTIVSHSMGCSVVWSWWDQFPASRRRIDKLVLDDQSAVMVRHPNWTDAQATQLAAIFTPDSLYALADDMAAQLPGLVRGFFSQSVSEGDFQFVLSENRKMTDAHASALLIDHAFKDWRDVLPRITVKTLVIAGELSLFPPAGVQWVASQIPAAKEFTFTAAEKGSHFAFWENPDRFNSVVKNFITSK
ncbi:Alpha/Beta hydrolase protein [Coniochaeta sp. 2T2.1]|nr:Alpha/Beta hydrolase protein [Coniochaeta sp. 2T2.1]